MNAGRDGPLGADVKKARRRRLIVRARSTTSRAGGHPVVFATKLALRTLGARVLAVHEEMVRLDHHLAELVESTAPSLLGVYGVGVHTAAAPCS